MNFYKTKRWQKKRNRILRRDEYLCRECKRYGRTTEAQTVHHIYPLDERPDMKLDSNNLISLCFECHEQMHDREKNILTEKGFRWKEKVNPPPS